MTITKKKFIALITSALLLLFFSNGYSSDYPNTSIAVVDLNELLNDSKVAINANEQIEKILIEIQEELGSEEKKLLDAQKELAEAQAIMAPEAFEVKRLEHEKNVQDFQAKSQNTSIKLDNMIANVRLQILEEIRPILELISEDKGITVVLEKGNVILNAENMDITKSALKQLNKNLPKIKVEFED